MTETSGGNEVLESPVKSAPVEELREGAAECAACPLYGDITQTVFGERPEDARIMLVGKGSGSIAFGLTAAI